MLFWLFLFQRVLFYFWHNLSFQFVCALCIQITKPRTVVLYWFLFSWVQICGKHNFLITFEMLCSLVFGLAAFFHSFSIKRPLYSTFSGSVVFCFLPLTTIYWNMKAGSHNQPSFKITDTFFKSVSLTSCLLQFGWALWKPSGEKWSLFYDFMKHYAWKT
jgi:hypothetical protein